MDDGTSTRTPPDVPARIHPRPAVPGRALASPVTAPRAEPPVFSSACPRPNISESHREISTRVPFCIAWTGLVEPIHLDDISHTHVVISWAAETWADFLPVCIASWNCSRRLRRISTGAGDAVAALMEQCDDGGARRPIRPAEQRAIGVSTRILGSNHTGRGKE